MLSTSKDNNIEDIIDERNDNRLNNISTNKEINMIEGILQANVIQSPILVDVSKRKQKSTLTPKQFTNSVEVLVSELELSYSDAIIQCADYYNIEIVAINKFLAPQVIEKLKNEAIGNRMLPKDSNIDPIVFT